MLEYDVDSSCKGYNQMDEVENFHYFSKDGVTVGILSHLIYPTVDEE